MSGPNSENAARGALWRLALLVLFVAAAVSVGLLLPPIDVEGLRAAFGGFGWLGAALFAVAYALITLSPVPKAVLNIGAGVVWGFAAGSVIVYIGALGGAAAAFWIARALGRDGVTRLLGVRALRVENLFARRGFLAILGLRLVPIVPFTALNYASGLTGVRFRDYGVATVIGIVPGTAAYVALGAFGIEAGPGFWVALGVLGVLALAGAVTGVVLSRRRASRRETSAGGDGDEYRASPGTGATPSDPRGGDDA